MRTSLLSLHALLILCIISITATSHAQTAIVKADNGMLGGYHNSITDGWEESVILSPVGPCQVLEVQIFMIGATAKRDTIWIVGDPAEGSVPPTEWVWQYNTLTSPVIVDYNGSQGWKTIDLRTAKLRCEGWQRVCVQHRFKKNGPWFAVDGNGAGTPYSSFLMTPYESSFPPSYNLPGKYYLAGGDFMIRLLVQYDRPSGSGSEPQPTPTLVDVTTQSGLTASGAPINAVQASIVDYDRDGWDDIAIGGKLFRNKGDGTFADVSAAANLSAGGTIWGDVDNDGYIDCFAANGWGNDHIYRNLNGSGGFEDVTTKSTVINNYPTMSPVWLDYDNDGKLDLFIANNRKEDASGETYYPDQLWHNDGNGAFSNVTQSAGIAAGEPAPYYDCYGAAACDYNNDGRIDIFVANYRLAPDNLYRNNGDGTFTEVGAATGVRGEPTASAGYFGHGMGCEWADFNNDGYPDLAVGNLGHPDYRGLVSNPSLIYRNPGAAPFTFTEVHEEMGLRFYEMNAGMCWLDLDNDGDLDLWHGQIAYNPAGTNSEPRRRGRIYLNEGAPHFKLKDVTWTLGPDVHGPWTAQRLDFDHDGDLDLLVCSSHEGVRLFRNDIPNKGNWIAVRMTGSPADRVPADAYGTRMRVYAGGRMFSRDLPGGGAGSRATQNSSELHAGLGSATAIDSLVLTYTNGVSRSFTSLAINHRYRIAYDGTVVTSVASAAPVASSWRAADVHCIDSRVVWTLEAADAVHGLTIDVYSTLGVRVASSSLADMQTGRNALTLGDALPAGSYFVRFTDGVHAQTARIILVR